MNKIYEENEHSKTKPAPSKVELVNIGTGTNTIKCRKVCLVPIPVSKPKLMSKIKTKITTSLSKHKSDQNNLFKAISGKNQYLPNCVIKLLQQKIDLNEKVEPVKSFSQFLDQPLQELPAPSKVDSILNMLLNINEKTISFYHIELSNSATKNKIISNNYNYRILFQTIVIVREIIQSYCKNKLNYLTNETKNTILQQISLDLPRMIINFSSPQNVKSFNINSIQELHNAISKYEAYAIDTTYNVYWLILLLCTQASFFYPYFLLHNLYTMEELDLFIMQDPGYPIIDIIDDGIAIDIVFQKTFSYKNINTKNILTKFHTFIVITINLHETNDGYIFYGKKYGSYNSSTIYWIKDNNLLIV